MSSASEPASASASSSASGSPSSSSSASPAFLAAFLAASDRIVDRTRTQAADFSRRRRRGAPARPGPRLAVERGVELFQERVELADASATSDTSTVVSAFGGGTLPGTLDEVLAGLYAASDAEMRRSAAIQFGDAHVADCGVLRAFATRSAARPHEFLGVKFLDRRSRVAGVLDQLCWVERLGTTRAASGQTFGFQLLKAADYDPLDAVDGVHVRRVRLSVCYLYAQTAPDEVDVFLRGIVELPAVPQVPAASREREAARTAALYLLAAVRGREIQRMSTITRLIERSKTDREKLTACHCSTVVRGLSKMDMCSGCREAMRKPKLVALGDADDRKHGSTAPSRSLEHLRLQSRLGSTRRDGEPPEDLSSFSEAASFRMLLPIHDARPASHYRSRQSDNVLVKMLRRRQRKLQVTAASGGDGDAGDSARTAASSAA